MLNASICLIYSTWPCDFEIQQLVRCILELKKCACINVFSRVESYFQGMEGGEFEKIIIFKCSQRQKDDLIQSLIDIHPYETPCILSFLGKDETPCSLFFKWVESHVEMDCE